MTSIRTKTKPFIGIILFLAVTACFNDNNPSTLTSSVATPTLFWYESYYDDESPILNYPADEFEVTVPVKLTIAISWLEQYFGYRGLTKNPIIQVADMFMKRHPLVEIELVEYEYLFANNYYVDYMADEVDEFFFNVAPDLIFGDRITFAPDFLHPYITHRMVDLYPLMKGDPSFNPNDYYMSVLEAMNYDKSLYAFPTGFIMHLIAVNNKVSDQLVNEFMEYPTVNVADLLRMHKSTMRSLGNADKNYFLYEYFDELFAADYMLGQYIDTKNRECSFNDPSFLDLLINAHNAADRSRGKPFGYQFGVTYDSSVSMVRPSQQSLFLQTTSWDESGYNHYMTYDTHKPSFSPAVPYADYDGRLIVDPMNYLFISVYSSEIETAWEFIKFAVQADSYNVNKDGVPDLYNFTPINKHLAKDVIENTVPKIIRQNKDWGVAEGEEYQIRMVQDKVDTYAEMPMVINSITASMPMPHRLKTHGILTEALYRFNTGDIAAEEAAEVIQREMSLFLGFDT